MTGPSEPGRLRAKADSVQRDARPGKVVLDEGLPTSHHPTPSGLVGQKSVDGSGECSRLPVADQLTGPSTRHQLTAATSSLTTAGCRRGAPRRAPGRRSRPSRDRRAGPSARASKRSSPVKSSTKRTRSSSPAARPGRRVPSRRPCRFQRRPGERPSAATRHRADQVIHPSGVSFPR